MCAAYALYRRNTMEHRLFNNVAALEVLHHYALEKLRRHARVPHAFGIDDHDRPAFADSETRSLAPLHTIRSEQQPFTLKQRRQQSVQRAAAAFR